MFRKYTMVRGAEDGKSRVYFKGTVNSKITWVSTRNHNLADSSLNKRRELRHRQFSSAVRTFICLSFLLMLFAICYVPNGQIK